MLNVRWFSLFFVRVVAPLCVEHRSSTCLRVFGPLILAFLWPESGSGRIRSLSGHRSWNHDLQSVVLAVV